MRKFVTYILLGVFLLNSSAFAHTLSIEKITDKDLQAIKYSPNVVHADYAFVFDGPSDKNAKVLENFKKAIILTNAPEFKPVFSPNNIFTGDWSEKGARAASDKALASSARVIVSLGYLTSKYYNSMPKKNKTVITIDQYGLRDLGDEFFSPVQRSANGIALFERLVHFKQPVLLMNKGFYNTRKDWDEIVSKRLPDLNVKVMPVDNNNIDKVISDVCAKYDAVILTPMFNLQNENKARLISAFNEAKIPTFSTAGKDDVEMGALLGSGMLDLDRKVAEATSFNIKAVLNGNKTVDTKTNFYEEQIVYINQDTAEAIGWQPHIRVLNYAQIISNKKPDTFNLSAVFEELYNNNLDIERKKALIKAARRSAVAAALHYLPSFGVTLGYQQYDHDYAVTTKLSIPEKTGVFKMGMDQIIYSPALVTNILIKRKKLDFSKAEQFLTEQQMGLEVAFLYIDTLMIENMMKIQEEYVKESRENLAIARVRARMGKCGAEEELRWAAQLSVNEQNLLEMRAELQNLKISINKLLFADQKRNFNLAPLTAHDPAFYTSELNVIDYVATPDALEKFTQMLVDEAYRVSPELEKLKLAIKMKDYESKMYYQKFVLPDAKLSLEYTSLMGREFGAPSTLSIPGTPITANLGVPAATNGRMGIFAQWTPFEGGTKIAEIGRVRAEREELKLYDQEVRTQLEQHIRETINKALSSYFSIEKNYKASFSAGENYYKVKDLYHKGEAPIAQLIDAQNIYLNSKVKAMNSQYAFFKELVWVQRGICAVDWTHASPEAKAFIEKVKTELPLNPDIKWL